MAEEEPKPQPTSVKDFGVFANQNRKHRRRMEDAHFTQDNFLENANQGFFGVYDGHAGKLAAEFTSNNLHKVFGELYKPEMSQNEVNELWSQVYKRTDELMKEDESIPTHHGCTVVTTFLRQNDDGKKELFCGNVGDGRIVLNRGGKAVRMTYDHKATDPEEVTRVTEAGGFVQNDRVLGQIEITRSLGDQLMKQYIINTPYTQFEELNDDDSFVVLACDGVWDVISDQQVVDFVTEKIGEGSTAEEISKALVVKAINDGSTDNLSVITVIL